MESGGHALIRLLPQLNALLRVIGLLLGLPGVAVVCRPHGRHSAADDERTADGHVNCWRAHNMQRKP